LFCFFSFCLGLCQISHSSAGILVFTITETSSNAYYTIDEAPVSSPPTDGTDTYTYTPPASTTSSSGGSYARSSFLGTITTTKPISYTVDPDLIKVLIKQGENKRESIFVKNVGKKQINFSVGVENISNILVISDAKFSLIPGETKTINVDIFAKENEIPDAYTGRIVITGDEVKTVNVIVEVKEKLPLFDISIDSGKTVFYPGDSIKSNIKVSNMGDLKDIDVVIYYAIKDFEGKIYGFSEESIAIEDELNLIRILKVPWDVPVGDYLLYSKVSYGNVTAASTYSFKIQEKLSLPFRIYSKWYVKVLIVIVMSLLLVFIWRFVKRLVTRIKLKKQEKQASNAVKPVESKTPGKSSVKPLNKKVVEKPIAKPVVSKGVEKPVVKTSSAAKQNLKSSPEKPAVKK